jgi:hypothetical protein
VDLEVLRKSILEQEKCVDAKRVDRHIFNASL